MFYKLIHAIRRMGEFGKAFFEVGYAYRFR
jgi:hypothetical protein